MTGTRGPTLNDLLGVLVQRGHLTPSGAQHVFEQEDAQRARIIAEARRDSPRAGRRVIPPLELLRSFDLRRPQGEPLPEDVVTEHYAALAGLPYVKLDPLELDPEVVTGAVSKPFARQHSLLAIEDRGETLVLATSHPFNPMALESLERMAQKKLSLVVASHTDVQRIITDFYGFRGSVKRAQEKLSAGVDISNLEQLVRLKSEREIEASDEHVVHAVEYMLSYAFQQRASDIHVEPKRGESVVRYRIDGTLHEVNRLPGLVHKAVINRIKTLARLDIGSRRRPQDGRIKTEFQGKPVEIRVSTLAVAFGEKAVMRVFDPDIVSDELSRLGFFPRELEVFERLIAQPHGIILVTGPTGSGKTTTLYTALRKLATDAVNITTIEDPIEMVFERINQTAINPAVDLGFSEALRTILRQDPDIIMVGEIRDLQTARYAVQASLTGHLVFSTLHTNDAVGAVTRLLDLGAEHFLLASTLSGLVAQRLVKRVCGECTMERVLEREEVEAILPALPPERRDARLTAAYGAGCVACRHSGYLGRSAIYEMVEVTDAIKKLVMERADAGALKARARSEGMATLREAAVRKMLEGITSYEQVLSVTQRDG
ncbi:MAG: ATPase, T2SS/T4P/T4SS family [Myxococcota bacterium]